MKVYIGPHKSYFGPYQLAEKILFWMDKDNDDRVHNFGQWLAGDSNKVKSLRGILVDDIQSNLLCKFLTWVDSKKKRKIEVRIDKYDTWNMDGTLAYIILPMLKQLQATKHGSPYVDDADVPENLRSTSAEPKENEWDTDSNHHLRWEWILDEMIWAFEQHHPDNDWEKQFHSGEHDWQWKESETGYENPLTGKTEKCSEMFHGPNHTHVYDAEGAKVYSDRIDNGFKLFGKYYRALWD
jgi:hypothetical protein